MFVRFDILDYISSLDNPDPQTDENSGEPYSPSHSTPTIGAAGNGSLESVSPSQENSAYSSAAGTPRAQHASVRDSRKLKQSAYAEGRPLKYSASGKVLGMHTLYIIHYFNCLF
jgi:hypothetical protein